VIDRVRLRQVAIPGLMAACAACTRPSPAVTPANAPLRFLPADSVTIDTVAPDIVHYHVRRPTGPFNIQIVTVPVHSRYEFTAARALDSLRGRERVTDMVRRHRERGAEIPVALNADFFDLEGRTGINENNQVIDGKVWKANPVTDSPFDTFRSSHTQFAVGGDGRPYIDRFSYAGTITGACGRFVLDGINTVPRVPNALVLFSHAYSGGSRRDSVHVPHELAVRTSATSGFGLGTLTVRVDSAAHPEVATIDSGWAVLAAYGAASARLDSIARCGRSLTLAHDFTPRRGSLTMVIGGWPRVVQDGRNVGSIADSLEGTFPRFSAQRHPRSAIGFSRDSGTVYLVAVDGRQETSDGMSLAELGDFLVSIGVYQGMNFDGGGSTTLVINGRLANRPSDAAGERPVGNAILIRVRPGS
jgi:phosphodiester glycosidase